MKIGLIDLNTGNLASLESAMRKLDISFNNITPLEFYEKYSGMNLKNKITTLTFEL